MSQVAYILSASHSGSTLLSMLLHAHPEVATVGELAPGRMESPDRYRCSCGAKIFECGFWTRLTDEAQARNVPFGIDDFRTRYRTTRSRLAGRLLRPLHRGRLLELVRDCGLAMVPGWARHVHNVARANEVLIELVCRYYGASVFVDKGNVALRLKFLLRNPALEVKVIRLVRDGRAVALTHIDPARYADASDESLRGGGMGGQREGEKLAMAAAAHEWRRSNEEAEHVLRRVPNATQITVRYEDLCAQPDRVLDRVFTFLGVDPARKIRDFRSVEHHVVGNGMRLDSTSEIRLDDRWRASLTAEQLAVFDRVAGSLNRRYGYT